MFVVHVQYTQYYEASHTGKGLDDEILLMLIGRTVADYPIQLL